MYRDWERGRWGGFLGNTVCFTHKETLERWGAAYLGAKLPGIPISGHILGGFVSCAAYFYFGDGGSVWNSTLASITEGRNGHSAPPLNVKETPSSCSIVKCHDDDKDGRYCDFVQERYSKCKSRWLVNMVVLKWEDKLKCLWIILFKIVATSESELLLKITLNYYSKSELLLQSRVGGGLIYPQLPKT